MSKNFISLSKLSCFLDNCKKIFADIIHTHTTSDITDFPLIPKKLSDLENDLDISSVNVDATLDLNSTNPVQNKVITEEVNNIKSTIGDIETLLESI